MSVLQGRTRRSRIPTRQPSGLYVHSSPPTALPVHPSVVRQWLRGGEIGRLTDLVLKGQGQTLVGEYSPDTKARKFINILPKILKRIDTLHDAARRNDLNTINEILSKEPKINLELSRDITGLGLLHKAVIHNYVDLQELLLNNYPATITVLDKEKRSALHYAGGTEHPEDTWKRLVSAGADINTVDSEGYTPAFYMHHPRRLRPPAPDSRGATSKRPNSLQNMIVKPSTIRIWIHDKDLGRLQKVLWEGLGDRLKTETSTNPVVRRFLNAVPYIMGSIREIHSAAINNDLELLKSRSQDPVPKDILLSRDINGLTPLHKAAGLGHIKIAKEILKKAPEAANVKDFYDRTPLHYAAALKDKGEMFQLLADNGSIDHLEDKKGNTPTYYRGKPAELDGPKLLNVIPDAPRTAHIFPPSWDWRLLGGKDPEQPDSASPLLSPMETSQTDDDRTATENDDTTAKDTEEEQTVSASQEEEPEEEVVSPRPDISEDEGVGSEVPVSGEEMTSPSDATNEEYEENQESRLVDSLFADLGVNGEIISDSGNEEEGTREEGDQEVKDEDTEAIVNMKAEEEGDNEQTDIAKDDLDTGNNDLSVQDALEEIADYENADIAKNDLDTSNTEQQKNDAEHFGVEINSEEETAQSSEYITLNNTIQTSYSLERQKTADSKSVENVENDEKTDELDDKNETSKTSEAIVNESRNSTAEDNISKSEENVEIQLNTEEEDKYKTEEEVENEAERLSSTSSKELVPIRSLSRGVEILSITPADPDEVDDEDLQEAVARGTPDVPRGLYLLARDYAVPHDVFIEGRTGFGHSSIFYEKLL